MHRHPFSYNRNNQNVVIEKNVRDTMIMSTETKNVESLEPQMVDSNQTENKMGVMPINKLLLTMSIPMMISMLIQGLYNVVDSIFVARICEDAFTAVSLAFPIQTLIIALGVGTGIGVNAILSKTLGEKKYEKVNAIAMNAIFIAFIHIMIFLLIGLFLVKPFYMGQTTETAIITYGVQYLTTICFGATGIFMQLTMERLLQATGNTIYAMVSQISGALLNLVLDPILIFGLFGMPKMGVVGAAIATIAGQVLAAALAFVFNLRKNKEIHFDFHHFRPSFPVLKEIYLVAIPSIIMQSISSVMTYGMNQILITFSSTATAVFGMYFKMQSFVFMPVFGLTHGLAPIVAYNFGAQKRKRLVQTIRLCLIYAIGIMIIGMIVMLCIPKQICHLFDASETMIAMGVPALRIIGLHFPFAAVGIILGIVFQALGNSVYSMIISICRQVLILLPVAYILSLTGNLNYVWFSFPIAELMALLLNIFFYIKIDRKIICKIAEE